MTELNFATMSREELREYVRSHPTDVDAFHAYMDKLQTEPGVEITSMEQFEQLVRDRMAKPQTE
jgi:hypothetical protein